ncbi:MAG TPA: hypothetical protein VGH74_08625 [Planctomycetaceae bacterium]
MAGEDRNAPGNEREGPPKVTAWSLARFPTIVPTLLAQAEMLTMPVFPSVGEPPLGVNTASGASLMSVTCTAHH